MKEITAVCIFTIVSATLLGLVFKQQNDAEQLKLQIEDQSYTIMTLMEDYTKGCK